MNYSDAPNLYKFLKTNFPSNIYSDYQNAYGLQSRDGTELATMRYYDYYGNGVLIRQSDDDENSINFKAICGIESADVSPHQVIVTRLLNGKEAGMEYLTADYDCKNVDGTFSDIHPEDTVFLIFMDTSGQHITIYPVGFEYLPLG